MSIILRVKMTHDRTFTCDETCYNAEGHECTCICHGLNHGVGEQNARRYARRHMIAIAIALRKTHPDITEIDLYRPPLRAELT